MKPILIVIFLSTALTGCISSPNAGAIQDSSYQDVQSSLIKGRTTKQQVVAKFGKPKQVQNTNGQETWVYYSSTIGIGVIAGQIKGIKSLLIQFQGDVVKDYTYSSQG